MYKFIQKFFSVCPKTGRLKKVKQLTWLSRLFFPVIGFLALVWILYRVISKPSRIEYPCVKAAMPFAGGFLGQLLILALSAAAFLRSKTNLFTSRIFLAFAFAGLGVGTYIAANTAVDPSGIKIPDAVVERNTPYGEARGIFPGRVVWVHDPDATNENCNPTSGGNEWFRPANNNQSVIDGMLSRGLKDITGEHSDSAAWAAIFRFHNITRGKGAVGYVPGEKIFLKTNATSSWDGNFNPSDLTTRNAISETSPEIILSVLRQLVNSAGVPQKDIFIGDPMKHIYKHCYDIWHTEFPDVHYLDNDDYSSLGRERAVKLTKDVIFYSDRGTVLKTNVWSDNYAGDQVVTGDKLYKIFEDAEYLINVPMLKGHKRAGITAFAKNHFGSQTRGDAAHLHNGLVAPTELPNVTRGEYGLYRIQVDLMGHYLTGKKNLIFIMDALWCSDQEISYPKKFYMAPFNNDWTSSIFLSFDPVAIESVGYDFLRSEFTTKRPGTDGSGLFAQMPAADDYLHQAADSAFWPAGIRYDPENDGTVIGSLGVHEHWNDSLHMQYSRNLGTGSGIELFKSGDILAVEKEQQQPGKFVLYTNYPNPFNPSTTIRFSIMESSNVQVLIYDTNGKLVDVVVDEYKNAGTYDLKYDGGKLSSGVYLLQMRAGKYSSAIKMSYLK